MRNMNSNELYLLATKKGGKKSSNGSFIHPCGLSTRVYHFLCRAGYKDSDGHLDVKRVYQDVVNGEIMGIYQIGKASVREICDWLEQKQKDIESNGQPPAP